MQSCISGSPAKRLGLMATGCTQGAIPEVYVVYFSALDDSWETGDVQTKAMHAGGAPLNSSQSRARRPSGAT